MERKNKGFTLIEMLVVVLIIGILAGIALPQYNKAVEKAKLSEALINAKAMQEAVKRFFLSGAVCPEDAVEKRKLKSFMVTHLKKQKQISQLKLH